MIHGETITLIQKRKAGPGVGGDTAWEELPPLEVNNVLIANGSGANSTETNRPDGTTVAATFAFPRDFNGNLRRATIKARGRVFQVIGNPLPVDGGITPTAWNLLVQATEAEG